MDGYRANNVANAAGKEVFEIHPVILGGHPTDPQNKTLLSRKQHIEAVVYWNREIKKMRSENHSPAQ